MENVRIAVLSKDNQVCAFMDNNAPNALHYYDDTLHNYLEGTSSTYEFTADAKHADSEYLVVGNHISFRYGTRDYYFNIMAVTRTETEVSVETYGLVFELLNEKASAYSATSAMTFTAYLKAFNFADTVLTINNNEVSSKKIKYEWTGESDTMLARLYSLATVFDAELEFVPVLRNDYSLDKLMLNIYKEHSDTVQGVGTNRTDEILRYGVNISGITKKSDITDMITAIRPFGKNDITISSLNKSEYDSSGNLEYSSPKGSRNILAVQAMEQFPSNTLDGVNDRYVVKVWNYDTDNVNTLYSQALAELKKLCVPQVKYTISGYVEAEIGDTFTVQDEEFTPELLLSVRVSEQEISFTDPSQNKTTYSNAVELESEVSEDLLKRVTELVEESKQRSLQVTTDKGTVFKNGEGETTLTASVLSGVDDVTASHTILWIKSDTTATAAIAEDEETATANDSAIVGTGETLTVSASDITGTAVYTCMAFDSDGNTVARSDITVVNVNDGTNGKDGADGKDGYSPKVSTSTDTNGNTVLTVTDASGTKKTTITDAQARKVATNFMKFLDSVGLVVGDMTAETLGRNILIAADKLSFRDGETELATFEDDEINLGISTDVADINMCGDTFSFHVESGAGYIRADDLRLTSGVPGHTDWTSKPLLQFTGNNIAFGNVHPSIVTDFYEFAAIRGEITLFESTQGINTAQTLNYNVSNFSYIEVLYGSDIYTTDKTAQCSVKTPVVDGAANARMMYLGNSNESTAYMQLEVRNAVMSGTSLTFNSEKYVNFKNTDSSVKWATAYGGHIRVYKIIGYY